MKDYNYRIGSYDRTGGFLSHFVSKAVILGMGGVVGFYMGAMVVIGEIQAGEPVLSDTPSSLSVEQPNVTSYAQFSEPDDYQAALGYGFVQDSLNTDSYQPAEVVGSYQPAMRAGAYQHTVTDLQVQGEKLNIN